MTASPSPPVYLQLGAADPQIDLLCECPKVTQAEVLSAEGGLQGRTEEERKAVGGRSLNRTAVQEPH